MQNEKKLGVKPVVDSLRFALLAMVGVTVLSAGCSSRVLTICQEDRINTAAGRHAGEPLDITVVCVSRDDLKKPENERLKPDTSITAKEWYDFRPVPGPSGEGRFIIPENQIYLLTSERGAYGIVKGKPMRGAIEDGKVKRTIGGIKFRSWKWGRSMIYVFPRFFDAKGDTLPVKPLKFRPSGSRYFSKVGVDSNKQQYIKKLDSADCGREK